ncbi:AAA domain-containing protein [Rapidithrix thailandica]|uniref:AAA domain-containing protein n=1 Tax=Rapidithrix thailandica TaxID=413964 RepID=A0AAW9SE42_9BACT
MEDLKQLLQLLKIEKEADFRQYQTEVLQTPLQERKKKGVTWYPVKVLRTEIGTGENFHLTLERSTQQGESHGFQVGGMVSVFDNGKEAKKSDRLIGVITSVWRDSMKVAVNVEELPDWLDYGLLGVDMTFDAASYTEMESAVEKVLSAEEGRLKELRDVICGRQTARFLPEEQRPYFPPLPALNDSQNKALQNILAARDVAIIHGPPGTGKTTTIVQAVKATLNQEKQVLVTAPSNTAVDLLTEKLAAQGLKVLRIGNPARVSEELIHLSVEAQLSEHEDYRYLKKLRKNAEEYKKMAYKYKRKYGRDEREQRKLLLTESRKMLDEATYLEKYMVDHLINDAQVITATLVGSVNKFIRHKTFSTVFIDEAAQSLEPACWIPIVKSERVVFAGDHCQLPPTIKSYEAAKQGLSTTLFEKVIKRQKVDVMLQTQYRMHQKIMNFSSRQFYKDRLIADHHVENWLLVKDPADPYFGNPVEFIDTAGRGFEEKRHKENLSKYNPGEAGLLAIHLGEMLEYLNTSHPHVLDEGLSIGLISPYKAQVSQLRQLLKENETLQTGAPFTQVNSIDGFQGQERDVIYISLVRSNEKGRIGFLEDIRRMNVALTRARKKLVVIGDSATLSTHPFYQDFLSYIDEIGAYKSAWEYAQAE